MLERYCSWKKVVKYQVFVRDPWGRLSKDGHDVVLNTSFLYGMISILYDLVFHIIINMARRLPVPLENIFFNLIRHDAISRIANNIQHRLINYQL